jgi:hypothetical protein
MALSMMYEGMPASCATWKARLSLHTPSTSRHEGIFERAD